MSGFWVRRVLVGVAVAVAAGVALATEATEPDLRSLEWVSRPIVLFADSEADPRLVSQLAELDARIAELEDRDVVIVVNTTPGEESALRDRFHPRDFQFLLVDKDGTVLLRKPRPVTVREIIREIDRTTLRRQEIGRDFR